MMGTPEEVRTKVADLVNLSVTITNLNGSAERLLEGVRRI